MREEIHMRVHAHTYTHRFLKRATKKLPICWHLIQCNCSRGIGNLTTKNFLAILVSFLGSVILKVFHLWTERRKMDQGRHLSKHRLFIHSVCFLELILYLIWYINYLYPSASPLTQTQSCAMPCWFTLISSQCLPLRAACMPLSNSLT